MLRHVYQISHAFRALEKNQQWICCIGTHKKLLYTFLQKILKRCSIRCNLEIWKKYLWDVCLLMAPYHRMDHCSLLLMEEILHHLECITLVNNEINYLPTGAGFQPWTVSVSRVANASSEVGCKSRVNTCVMCYLQKGWMRTAKNRYKRSFTMILRAINQPRKVLTKDSAT